MRLPLSEMQFLVWAFNFVAREIHKKNDPYAAWIDLGGES